MALRLSTVMSWLSPPPTDGTTHVALRESPPPITLLPSGPSDDVKTGIPVRQLSWMLFKWCRRSSLLWTYPRCDEDAPSYAVSRAFEHWVRNNLFVFILSRSSGHFNFTSLALQKSNAKY
ncbi:hypothetical protein IAQ61_002281, partial [Plenodomus lingam]|uniref:uncharacterized protein n=1 Tax=Leptosphaeria maculans TaxID=5022 RepID=UPI00331DFE52